MTVAPGVACWCQVPAAIVIRLFLGGGYGHLEAVG